MDTLLFVCVFVCSFVCVFVCMCVSKVVEDVELMCSQDPPLLPGLLSVAHRVRRSTHTHIHRLLNL